MSSVDWDLWLNMPTVKLWQACALSLDIDPDKMTHGDKEKDYFHKRLRLLTEQVFFTDYLHIASISRENIDSKIYLESFAEWALDIKWDIPKELKALVTVKKKIEDKSNENS